MVDATENQYVAQLEERTGKPNHFFRTMANRPEALKTFVALYGAIMGPGSVDRRTKELVYLTVSFTNRCPYCSAAHRASGAKAGITEDEMTALEAGRFEGFTEAERAAIRYARELTLRADAPESREALGGLYKSEQIVELTLVVAMANFTNRFNNGLSLQPE